jgi:hypothetical protein
MKTRFLYGLLLTGNMLGLALGIYVLVAVAPAMSLLSTAGSTTAASSSPATRIPALVIFGVTWAHPAPDSLYLIIVVAAAAIGAAIHALTSLSTFVGNRSFVATWTWWYVIRVPVGTGIAAVLYFLLRAGFVSIGPSGGNINAYGVAAFSGLAGMFSKQAVDKMRELFDTMFKSGGDAQRKDKVDSSFTIDHAIPASLPAGSANLVITVVGQGFTAGIQAGVSGQRRDVTVRSSTEVQVTLQSPDVAVPGIISLMLTAPGPEPAPARRLALRVFPVITAVGILAPGSTLRLRVSGVGLAADGRVLVDGSDRTSTSVEEPGAQRQIVVDVTDEDYAQRGQRRLVVVNPDASGGSSDPFALAGVEGW